MRNLCSYEKFVFIREICVRTGNLCSYGKFVFIREICVPIGKLVSSVS